MSRRDTIIVAVLVNAALLMILFATAIRKGDSGAEIEKTTQMARGPVPEAVTEEDLLSQYVSSVPTLAQEDPLSFSEEIELSFTSPPKPVEEKKPIETPKRAGNYVDVTVKKGDFLEKIAKANNTTVAAIMEANHLSSTQLKIGQVLKVPLSNSKPNKPTTSSSSEGEYYVVKEGDNPWLIASRNNIRLDELLRLNGLDEQKARRIRPGDRLRIR